MKNLTEENWAALLHWYNIAGRHKLPWRQKNTPWAIFVAENLLRRTRSTTIAAIFNSIIKQFPSVESVITNKDHWKKATSTLGLQTRADQFIKACEVLVTQHRGHIPRLYSELIALPGVGHYIANAVLCFGHGVPTYIIDTNTLRVASRVTGNIIPQEKHRTLDAISLISECFGGSTGLPANKNYALLDLAHLVCTPSKPRCTLCPLSSICQYASITKK